MANKYQDQAFLTVGLMFKLVELTAQESEGHPDSSSLLELILLY